MVGLPKSDAPGNWIGTAVCSSRLQKWNVSDLPTSVESSLNRSLLGLFLEIAGCASGGGIDFANISITKRGEEEDRVEIDLRQMPIKATRKFGFRPFRLY